MWSRFVVMESQPSTTSVKSTSSDTTMTSTRSLLEILKLRSHQKVESWL